MNIQLKFIDPEADPRWDDFVQQHPEGSIYHHSAWKKVLEETYGFDPFYVALENKTEGTFEGIVPFMLVNSWLTGKRLVSLPFTSYCNPIVPEGAVQEVAGPDFRVRPRLSQGRER